MRGLALFVAGSLVGLVVAAPAQNTSPNRGIVGLNHVALSVPDIDKAVEYYTKMMGFPKHSGSRIRQGQIQLVYVQISQNTFIELQPSNRATAAGDQPFRLARREHGRGDRDVQGAGRQCWSDQRQRYQGDPVQYRRPQRRAH